jgi:probable F420-dependent oxidoreductase
MLRLAGQRSAGVHPYLVTPAHTKKARDILGPGPLIAPEQKVVLETDPVKAREIARAVFSPHLGQPNYTNNLLRMGFTTDDLADGGSDRLIDAVIAWGDVDSGIERRGVDQHVAVDVPGLQRPVGDGVFRDLLSHWLQGQAGLQRARLSAGWK